VSKSSVWYLVADTDAGQRTFRVGRVRSVEFTGEPAVRPEGFDLAEAWQGVVEAMDERRNAVRALVVADPSVVGWLRGRFGTQASVRTIRDDGRVEVEVGAWSPEALAHDLIGFGGHLEVVDPPEVRDRMREIGAELVARYSAP
jgi:predicted DNA-binding transcriptional regulator YafY